MTAHTGNYLRGGISGLTFTPAAALAVQDSPQFKELMDAYYKQFPDMRKRMEDKNGVRDNRDSGVGDVVLLGRQPGTEAVDLAEEAARQQDDKDDHIDGRIA